MISLNRFPILIAVVLFPGAIVSAAEEDSAPQTKQTRYEQLAVHAVRRLLFDDAESARALSGYYGQSESESQAEVSALVETRSYSRQWLRNTYSAMKTAELENIRARYFRSIDAIMANGRCDVSGSGTLPAPGTGIARRKVTVSCSFANIAIPEEAKETTRSRRERLELLADAAARAVTSEPVRRFEWSVELYRPRVPETAKWKVDSGSLVRFASVMHEEAFEEIEEAAFYRTRDSAHPEDMGGMSVQAVGQLILDSAIRQNKDSYLALTNYHGSGRDEPFEAAFEHLMDSGEKQLMLLSEGFSQSAYGPLPVLEALPQRVREARCTVTGEEPTALGSSAYPVIKATATCLVPMPAALTDQDSARLRGLDPETRMAALIARYTEPTGHVEPRAITASVVLRAGEDRWMLTNGINTSAAELMVTLIKQVKAEVDSLFDNYDPCDCEGMET
ncbi:hypothetical protein [Stenotrophomonas maltophilia]|uniref:hypothetical protein n=1 Tax=Stenotrophomonas maltophilia TaxID=40324 RepID=UPI003B9E05CD